jgi:membrane-associated phospholipid phosphatase
MFWVFLAALGLATLACILWVDQPVALYVAAHGAWHPVFAICAVPSLLMLPLAGLVLPLAIIRRLRGQPAFPHLGMAMALATLASTAAKDELKWLFGRPWPSTWLHYGLYGFSPFTDNILFGSFPSGHTAYIAAPMGVLWMLRPRLRVVWGGIIALVMLGLVGANYHFCADVLAGLMTGALCAWGTLVLYPPRQGASPVR